MLVTHHGGSYEIAFSSLDDAVRQVPAGSFWITDANVARLYGSRLGDDIPLLVVAPGEKSKSVESWARLQSELATTGFPRTGTLIAFGGGVVGDLAGFVAATYM